MFALPSGKFPLSSVLFVSGSCSCSTALHVHTSRWSGLAISVIWCPVTTKQFCQRTQSHWKTVNWSKLHCIKITIYVLWLQGTQRHSVWVCSFLSCFHHVYNFTMKGETPQDQIVINVRILNSFIRVFCHLCFSFICLFTEWK